MNTTIAQEKENNKKAKPQPRPAAIPPRARTPSNPVHQYIPVPGSSHGTKNTPALRSSTSSSSNTSTRSAPARRTKLGESTDNAPSIPPVPPLHRSGPGFNRQPSPKFPGKGSLPTSLPRPAAVPAPRTVSYQQYHALGPSRTTSSRARHNPYPQTNRVSPAKTAVRVYSSTSLNSNHQAAVAKKAARVRRESFKPRPSVDPGEEWSGGGDRRFPGIFGGTLPEEDEDF